MGKLIQTMKYIGLTQWIPLKLELYDILILKWYVDASYVMHNGFLSHTGDTLFLGKGYPYSKLINQKLNKNSATEDELIGLENMMPMIIWTRYFMNAQVYHITDNIVN